jgi:hypothetical protein
MSTDEYATEMNLYGVSPNVIAILMFITTLAAPYGIIPLGVSEFSSYWMLYSLIWVFDFGGFFGFGFRVLNVELMLTLPLCILNVAFAVWIVRYYQGRSSKYTAMTIGLLSVILPAALILYFSGLVIFIYPIPIQFIVGLIILWRIEGPEVISPWSGMRLDLSWWKWRKPKRKDDWDPFEKEKRIVKKEDWLKDDNLTESET